MRCPQDFPSRLLNLLIQGHAIGREAPIRAELARVVRFWRRESCPQRARDVLAYAAFISYPVRKRANGRYC